MHNSNTKVGLHNKNVKLSQFQAIIAETYNIQAYWENYLAFPGCRSLNSYHGVPGIRKSFIIYIIFISLLPIFANTSLTWKTFYWAGTPYVLS